MVNRRRIVILLLCLTAAAAGFFLLHQSEADTIRSQLKTLSELTSKNGPESPIIAVSQAKKTAELFTDPCFLKIPQAPYDNLSGPFSRQDIRAYTLRARSGFEQISLDLHDISISLPETVKARARLTAHLHAASNNTQPLEAFHELRCLFQKIDGQWYIKEITAVDVLER